MTDWMQFALDLVERPGVIHAQAEQKTQVALAKFNDLAEAGTDFIHYEYMVSVYRDFCAELDQAQRERGPA
jgi:hypothetical protein